MMPSKLLSGFNPEFYKLSQTARILPVIGALIAISLVTLISQQLVDSNIYPVLVASMGASAVLLFVVPSSPMAQPWPFVGGHLVSTFIGITCTILIPDLYLAAAIAVSLSILLMMYLGCLHPPGGAVALAFMLSGPETQSLGYYFILAPVALNVAVMLMISRLFNSVRILIKRKPQVRIGQLMNQVPNSKHQPAALFTKSELDAALTEMETFIDISHEDLNTIYSLAHASAQQRKHANKTCGEVMSSVTHSVEFGTSLQQAWHLMQDHELQGLAVLDRSQHLIGLIFLDDFIKHSTNGDGDSLDKQIEIFIAPSGLLESSKPEVVGQLMHQATITAGPDEKLSTILTLSKHKGLLTAPTIVPVIDAKNKLLGVINLNDL